MNWGEFKAAVEARGVSDETELDWIDYDGSEHLKVELDESGRINVVETWLADDKAPAESNGPLFGNDGSHIAALFGTPG